MADRVSNEVLDAMIEAVPMWFEDLPRTTEEEIEERAKCTVAATFLVSALEELRERRGAE